MGRYSGKTCRLLTMLSMTASFFLVEIIVGYITNSIALVADSFHMLSDVVSLIVGFAAVRISKWPTEKNTYGWRRAEVLGALVNAVFLVALCFSILVEALKRLVDVESIEDPKLLLIVGGAGLLINILGLVLFHNHGHSHGGHGHSHSGKKKQEKENEALISEGSTPDTANGGKTVVQMTNGDVHHSNITIEMDEVVASGSQLNMKGVFLHVLGDALGSVIVVISALVIWFAEGDWKYYIDPAMSIIMVIIILFSTLPLLRDSARILLQTIPSHVDLISTKEKVSKVPGIKDVHEFHVWQLAGNNLIGSVHILLEENVTMQEFMGIAYSAQDLLHKAGIHSCTVQPEYCQEGESRDRPCLLECGPDKACHRDTCCPQRKKSDKSKPEDKTKDKHTVQLSRLANHMQENSEVDLAT